MKAILILVAMIIICALSCNDRGADEQDPIDTTIVIIDTTSNPVDTTGN